MKGAWEICDQTFRSVWAHKLRSTLTMFGIAWGIASIIFMMAIGDGFKIGYKKMMNVLGTDVLIIWGGRTSSQAGDQRAGRWVRLNHDDVKAIEQECYLIKSVSPEINRSLRLSSPHNSGLFSTHGIAPVYQTIRSMELAAGRHINQEDCDQDRCVCIIGDDVRKQLFADRQALGAEVTLGMIPFRVIGVLRKKDQNNAYNGMDNSKVLVPYPTMTRHFPGLQPAVVVNPLNNIICMPVSADAHDEALRQVRATLGRRHQFDPKDQGALWIWDTVESARMVAKVFASMQIFLGFVAVVTLGLGGVGVMNIMLVSVAERTREIGVKKAIGAKSRRILLEFFMEALLITFVSGTVGLVAAWSVSSLVNRLPLPTMFAGLPITPATAAMAFFSLVTVGVLSGVYPARRASRLPPVEALRHE